MFRQKDDAASDVIAFILILALLISAVAGWMLVIVPGQGLEAENAHNEKVLQEFTELKTGIDQLWLNNMNGYGNSYLISLAPSERTSLSTLMYLAPTLGSGMIKIEKGTSINLTDTIRKRNIVDSKVIWHITKGTETKINLLRLSYYTDNQYAPNFIITYEGGAVWYSDTDGKTYLMVDPFSDHIEAKRFVLLAASKRVAESTLLGNMPVTVRYRYEYSYENKYVDDRVVVPDVIGGLALNKTREYVELYGEYDESNIYKGAVEIQPASASSMDLAIANYWNRIFLGATAYNNLNMTNVPNPAGSEVQIMYYDLSVTGGAV